MANYESAEGITSIFDNAAAAGGVSQATANAISSLIQDLQSSGSSVAVAQDATSITQANVNEVAAPIIMMGKGETVNATFDANSDVKAVVLNDASAASNIKFETSDDVTVQLGGATGDQVTTGGGDDTIAFAGGSATVDTGDGNDTIALRGNGDVQINAGDGNATIELDTDAVQATIDAGDGFDNLTVSALRDAFTFTVNSLGQFVMNSVGVGRAAGDGTEVVMDGVNVVEFHDSATTIGDIAILASNEGQATVGRLYQVALGREAIDANGTNVDGLKFWFEQLEGNNNPDQVYQAMLACPEFGAKYGESVMGNEQFVQAMMNNMGSGITTVNGQTAAEYAAQLAAGTVTRAELAIDFAQSDEAVTALGLDGTGYVIEGF